MGELSSLDLLALLTMHKVRPDMSDPHANAVDEMVRITTLPRDDCIAACERVRDGGYVTPFNAEHHPYWYATATITKAGLLALDHALFMRLRRETAVFG